MGKFYDMHRNLYNAEEIDREGTKYTRLSRNGIVVHEQWTKINGEWVDTTAQAQAEIDAEILAKKNKHKVESETVQAIKDMPVDHEEQYQDIIDAFIQGGKNV